jgi:DNA modification methylase
MTVRIITGDCRVLLRALPDESVHCVVTSPPYWGLRDYGVEGGVGLEETVTEHVDALVATFREVRRVLRADGTLWVNYGDAYAGSWGAQSRGETIGEKSMLSGGQVHAAPKGTHMGSRKRTPGLKPKDLIGLPWRLAFALQQPDYLGRIRDEADRAWLAALIDGEGCISILECKSGHGSGPSYPPILQVRMCDPECIEYVMRMVGSESENPAQYPPSIGGQRPAFQWRIHARKAADTIAEIYPRLLIKRKQAIVAWNAQSAREGYDVKRGSRIPASAVERQQLCRDIIQKLNKREPVDLPSWMVEPKAPVGPGWYLRQDVIWSKPNPMPESVTDRCTKAHEYIFLLSKSERYYFDQEAIKESAAYNPDHTKFPDGWDTGEGGHGSFHRQGREKGQRTIGTKGNTKPIKMDAHIDRRKRGFNQRWDASEVERSNRARDTADSARPPSSRPHSLAAFEAEHERNYPTRNKRSVWTVGTAPFKEAHFATFPPSLIEPCILAGCPRGGVVLDPFGGAGTTGLVADRLGRDAILIELNPTYADMARSRIGNDAPLFAKVAAE